MKVISKGKGPNSNNLGIYHLTENKIYDVVNSYIFIDDKWKNFKMEYNPSKPEFMISIIDDRGLLADYWNDYFYSSEYVRNHIIESIINK